MDRRCNPDPEQARTQAEDGSARCAAYSETHAERRLSEDLGAELGEPGSAAAAVAPTPHGASANSNHEPTAGGGVERRTALQEEVVAGRRTRATGIVSVGPMGKSPPARSAGVAGSTESDDRRAEPGHRARSREVPGSAATDDASRCGGVDRFGLRADHWQRRALPVWKAGGELSRTCAAGKVQRESAAAGAHHQAGEFDGALSAGGSSPGDGAEFAGVAQSVLPSDGAPLGGSFVLYVASGLGLSAGVRRHTIAISGLSCVRTELVH